MKTVLIFIVNIPYTLFGVIVGILCIPNKINFNKDPMAIIMTIGSFWCVFWVGKGARAITIGQVALMGPNLEKNDLEHELVHVEQMTRKPFIQPILYFIERIRKGYRNNKYEIEAYTRAGNIYKSKVDGE